MGLAIRDDFTDICRCVEGEREKKRCHLITVELALGILKKLRWLLSKSDNAWIWRALLL